MARRGDIGIGTVVLALVGVAAVAGLAWVLMDIFDVTMPWDRDSERATKGTHGDISAKNSSGRSGSYYLPEDYRDRALPMMVAFHGTSGTGLNMVKSFGRLADEYGFIIVAPDSRISPDGLITWQVGDRSYEITEDYLHTLSCIDEVIAIPGVRIDMQHILAAGFSGGASSAPYIATREYMFTAFAVLHGGVFPGGLGKNKIPGWFSTGESDPMRPPDMVEKAASSIVGLGFANIAYRTFPGGHGLQDEEKRSLLEWWLGK